MIENIRIFLLAIGLCLFPFFALGQNEGTDSTTNYTGDMRVATEYGKMPADSISSERGLPPIDFSRNTFAASVMLPSLSNSGTIGYSSYMMVPREYSPHSWDGGGLFGTAAYYNFPGLMRYDSANLGVYQTFGDFTIYAGGVANRYGNYWGGVHTRFGVEASMAYQIAPWLSANAFGTYYFGQPPSMPNGMPMSPAMAGFYGRSNFGAAMDFKINEHWGVEAGAQMVQQIGTNRYEAEPIATPYYKINKNVKIRLPVGQILYHVLRKR